MGSNLVHPSVVPLASRSHVVYLILSGLFSNFVYHYDGVADPFLSDSLTVLGGALVA